MLRSGKTRCAMCGVYKRPRHFCDRPDALVRFRDSRPPHTWCNECVKRFHRPYQYSEEVSPWKRQLQRETQRENRHSTIWLSIIVVFGISATMAGSAYDALPTNFLVLMLFLSGITSFLAYMLRGRAYAGFVAGLSMVWLGLLLNTLLNALLKGG